MDQTNFEDFRDRATRLGVTHADIRRGTGISKAQVSRFFNGLNPSPQSLEKINKYLNHFETKRQTAKDKKNERPRKSTNSSNHTG